MRITLVVHQFPPQYFTGTEQYALAVAKQLLRAGHDVDVFTLDPDHREGEALWRESRETVEGVPVRRMGFWWQLTRDWARTDYRHALMAETFAAHLRQRDTEVVHSFHLRNLGADLLDRAVEQRRGVVVSLTDFWFLCPRILLMRGDGTPCDGPPEGGRGCLPCHAPDLAAELAKSPVGPEIDRLQRASAGLSRPGWELLRRAATHHERWPYLRERLLAADAIVAPTAFLREVFVRNGVPADRIVHRAYGVDTGDLAAEVARLRPTAARPLTFGFFGTLAPHKAPHVLVDAMAAVRGDCRAILRGRPSDFPDYSRPLLERAGRDARIAALGPYDRDGLAATLASIDVLVVPSVWHENAPFVVLEARAAGLPVLASRFGGLAEVVRDEVDGELFAPGDAADLARRMQRLCDEPQRLARYAAATRPPKALAAAVGEFEALYAACRRSGGVAR